MGLWAEFALWNISDASLGVEELGHLEMVGALVHQLTRNLKDSQIEDAGFAPYFVDHTAGVYPTAASGFPWSASSMQVKGDPIADLTEDLAADATTTKEQPVFSRGKNHWYYKLFSTYEIFIKMACLQSHKNNMTGNYTIFKKSRYLYISYALSLRCA